MNESMTQTVAPAAENENDHWRECLSALVDGELDPQEFEGLMAAIERDPELQAVWARYQTLGPLVVRASAALPPAPATNDPVFWRRWAVAASFVAISTVTWGLLEQSAPDSSRLAQGQDTVWLSSAAGPMMRDPLLEELLQQHREMGDSGALQVSTGFLRSATLHTTP